LSFKSWWQALSAVPPNSAGKDWWAQEDGRSSRYDRLCRVWGDPTDGVPPPYFKADKEKHLVSTLWENFAIFAPADSVAALYREFHFDTPGPATDVCWSYEFNLGHQDRQLDIVMHVRFNERDEVVIGEAKAGRKPFAPKDLEPQEVLSREVFRFAEARRFFLLGDAIQPDNWSRCGYGYLTWQRLYALQSVLCATLPETRAVRDLIKRLIRAQFAGHGIATDSFASDTSITSIQAEAGIVLADVTTERCRNFISCAVQHVRCLQGLPVDSTPMGYLSSEPGIEQIKRHWSPGCGGLAVNGKAYWKLPPLK